MEQESCMSFSGHQLLSPDFIVDKFHSKLLMNQEKKKKCYNKCFSVGEESNQQLKDLLVPKTAPLARVIHKK